MRALETSFATLTVNALLEMSQTLPHLRIKLSFSAAYVPNDTRKGIITFYGSERDEFFRHCWRFLELSDFGAVLMSSTLGGRVQNRPPLPYGNKLHNEFFRYENN